MYRHEPGAREYPCPDESCSLEEAITDQLDELDADVVQAFAEFCGERIEVPLSLIAALVPLLNYRRRWESVRNRTDELLGNALDEIAYEIDQLKPAFISYEAARRTAEAEHIQQEAA